MCFDHVEEFLFYTHIKAFTSLLSASTDKRWNMDALTKSEAPMKEFMHNSFVRRSFPRKSYWYYNLVSSDTTQIIRLSNHILTDNESYNH